MPNFPIEDWRASWDVDNHLGYVQIDLAGPTPPATLPPLAAADFTAICQVLIASRMTGKPLFWNSDTKSVAI